ncbi:MAG TPA: hypothetical protein VJY39_06060 [Acidisphaera sp.]|nr:hypothetical protein [Acidisphaera sp.]
MTALPRLDDVHKIDFGSTGNSGRFVRTGWGVAEAGFRWMTGQESRVGFPVPDPGSDYMLLLDATPFVAKSALPAQRLTVLANGYELAAYTLGGRRVLPVFMPADVLAGSRNVELVLKHPDARRISDVLPVADTRDVSVSLRSLRVMRLAEGAAAPLPTDAALPGDRHLMLLFESLGETDAFVRVQRAMGADPLGLLRGADLPIHAAIDLLASDFADIDNAKRLVATRTGTGWTVRHRTYAFSYTTDGDAADAAAVIEREAARLAIGAARLRRVLAGGDKIFVFTAAAPIADEEIIPLLVALRARGPNTLLWVAEPAEGVAPGTVEPVLEGALRGHVRQVRPAPDAKPEDLADWLAVCRGAWALWDRRDAGQLALAS